MNKEPEELLQDLIRCGAVNPGELTGSSESKINELQDVFGVTLPESYKHFVKVMGRDENPQGGGFYSDYQMFYIEPTDFVIESRERLMSPQITLV